MNPYPQRERENPAIELAAVDIAVNIRGRQILDGIGFTASSGEWLTLTGPSGSGKSLLLQVLAGLVEPTRGKVLLNGETAWEGQARTPSPGYVPQDFALIPLLTATETVSLPLQARGERRSRTAELAAHWLGTLGLSAAGDQLVSNLSGGQRQRVAIARALAMASPLLLLDEPTAELDSANREAVVEVLKGRLQEGSIVVIASHDPSILAAGDKTLELAAEGRLVTT